MSTTGEDNHLIFPQKFSSSDYLFVYDYGDNNVVDLIHPIKDSAYTPEADILDKEVVETMGEDMLDSM